MTDRHTQIYHVIKDPVHGSMQLTEEENNWLKPFINSENFQRLRHIKQLGLGDYIFPGAVHTRFNHALGCCYVAGQIAHKLNLAPEERKVVMIAGLLHDIGHGPFSHAFEGVFHETIRHEDWTPFFLKEYLNPQFLELFTQRNKNFRLTHEEFELIQRLIMHKETEKKLLADIVSSQLDADRLDYLRRDSHFCGVNYGEFDFRWLIHCLAIIKDSQGFDRLGITEKGIGVVEQYLLARRLMMKNIYHHGKKFAIEYWVTEFLRALAHSVWEENLFPEVKDEPLVKFLKSANGFTQTCHSGVWRDKISDIQIPDLLRSASFTEEVDRVSAMSLDLSSRNFAKQNIRDLSLEENYKKKFLNENYFLYKNLCDYDVFALIRKFSSMNGSEAVIQLAKRLHNRILPKVFHLEENQISAFQDLIKHIVNQSAQTWQIGLLAIPHQSYIGSQDPILIQTKTGKVKSLQDDSLLISGLSDKSEHIHFAIVDVSLLENNSVKQFFSEYL